MESTKMTKLKLEIQILLMKYRHLMTPELEQKFDELHDEIESDEEWKCLDIQNIMKRCAGARKNYKKKKRREMPKHKPQASNKQQASSHKLETQINLIHDHWAFDNGYKPQAPRHKLRQNVARYNASDYKDSSNKPQAS